MTVVHTTKNTSPFWVIAVPNQARRSLEDFAGELNARLAASKIGHELKVHELTQLVEEGEEDEDGSSSSGMGDCFVVELVSHEERDPGDDDTPTLTVPPYWSDMILEELFRDTAAEVWVEGQGSLPLAPPYGWTPTTFRCDSSLAADTVQHTLQTYGLAFVVGNDSHSGEKDPHHHDVSRVYQDLQTRLRAHIHMLEDTVRQHHPHIRLGESAFGFQEYTHRGIERFEVLFDPTSSLYQLACEGLEHQWIDMVCRYLKRDRAGLRRNISCVYSRPGATDQDWHTDGDHLGPNHNNDEEEETPYALCVFVPLIALTTDTGFTRFWPKSHRYPHLLGLARAADALQATIDGVNLQPGDFILYDYTTWHKGVGNTSDRERPVLQFLYSADWYVERKNYGTTSVFDVS